jgi:hypothetical protein
VTGFDDSAATWGVLTETERKVPAAIDRQYTVTPLDVAQEAGVSRQRAVICARMLKRLGLVRVVSLPKQTSYKLTGQGRACLKAGRLLLDSSQDDA